VSYFMHYINSQLSYLLTYLLTGILTDPEVRNKNCSSDIDAIILSAINLSCIVEFLYSLAVTLL